MVRLPVRVNFGYYAVNVCYVPAAKEELVNSVEHGNANERGA
jgi:hypothetical protein